MKTSNAHTQATVNVADFPEDPNEEVVKEQAKVVGVITSNAKVEEDASIPEQDAEATMIEEAQAVQRKEVEEAAEANKKVKELNHITEQERVATKKTKAEEDSEEAKKAPAKKLAVIQKKAGLDLSHLYRMRACALFQTQHSHVRIILHLHVHILAHVLNTYTHRQIQVQIPIFLFNEIS